MPMPELELWMLMKLWTMIMNLIKDLCMFYENNDLWLKDAYKLSMVCEGFSHNWIKQWFRCLEI